MKKIIFLSRIHGMYWSRNGNIIDWGNTFLSRGKSTDSAMANENKSTIKSAESKKSPRFILKTYCPELNSMGVFVGRKANDKDFIGILVFEDEFEKAQRIDSTLISANVSVSFKGGDRVDFVVLDFFTDNVPFHVEISDHQDSLRIINFKRKLFEN